MEPDSAASVIQVLQRYSEHPSAYLALNDGTEQFRAPGVNGLIAYADAGRKFTIQVGGIYAADTDKAALAGAFLDWLKQRERRLIAVQLHREDALIYQSEKFSVNQLGSSYSIGLEQFSLKGTRFMKLRNKISRASRERVVVAELGVELPYSAALEAQADALDGAWLKSKGSHVKQLRLLVGDRGTLTRALPDRRVFVATREDALLGYISYRRSYGSSAGWMHDLSRRIPDQTPGILELCNSRALERFRREGASYLHFGFTPFVGLCADNELAAAYSSATGWVLRTLGKHGSAIYPAQTQVEYKLKWFPTAVVPEFIAFQGGFSLSGLFSLLKITQSI